MAHGEGRSRCYVRVMSEAPPQAESIALEPTDVDPIALYASERARAEPGEPWEAAATVLATVDATGRPKARYVLVKEIDEGGFRFYTNGQSDKAEELRHEPRAALCTFWPSIGVQFRVEGTVEAASDAVSDAYFATRPRISQLGAWASDQSRPLASREVLLARLAEAEARFEGGAVTRPPHWRGFVLVPTRIEHWVNGDNRLHDRFVYERHGQRWTRMRLCP